MLAFVISEPQEAKSLRTLREDEKGVRMLAAPGLRPDRPESLRTWACLPKSVYLQVRARPARRGT
jgi:hypothetical protein